MLFINGNLFHEETGFSPGSFRVENGRFVGFAQKTAQPARYAEASRPESHGHNGQLRGENQVLFSASEKKPLAEEEDERVVDLQGLRVIPGLVDIHIHGCLGHDFSDGDLPGLRAMGRFLARRGITAFAPTSMTLPQRQLETAFRTASAYAQNPPEDGARLLGIHMEGPYFSEKKKGAQNAAFLKHPNAAEVLALHDKCNRLLRFVDVAPELPGAEGFVREISRICKVSIAHTNATYEEALRAFAAGATHVTHLFNGMPDLLHREPGVVGAAFDKKNVAVELIGDGLHNHPSVIRAAFALFPGRICLISDSLRTTGMPDGEYELGGQKIRLFQGVATLVDETKPASTRAGNEAKKTSANAGNVKKDTSTIASGERENAATGFSGSVKAGVPRPVADGTLAGASTDLFEDLRRVLQFGVPERDAILAATKTPAVEAGVFDEMGSLEEGKLADFLVLDEAWNIRQVFLGGKVVALS